jgi:hypothetical protein
MEVEMNRKNTDALLTAAPNLYRLMLGNRGPLETGGCLQSLALFGFECGDGWFDLLLELSEALEGEILKAPPDARGDVYATQVKEKYGTLRVYMSLETDNMFKLIQAASKKSAQICEMCGRPGKITSNGYWLITACGEHEL